MFVGRSVFLQVIRAGSRNDLAVHEATLDSTPLLCSVLQQLS